MKKLFTMNEIICILQRNKVRVLGFIIACGKCDQWNISSLTTLPAPVALEQGTTFYTTDTESFDPINNCRVMVNPIILAPMIMTSKLSQQDADIGCHPDKETDSGRFLNLVVLVDTNLEPKIKLLLLLNSLFEYETTSFSGEMRFGFGQQNDEAEAIFLYSSHGSFSLNLTLFCFSFLSLTVARVGLTKIFKVLGRR